MILLREEFLETATVVTHQGSTTRKTKRHHALRMVMMKNNGVFLRFNQVLLGWKTCKYHDGTDELPQPKADLTKENLGLKWHLSYFFPLQEIFFRRLILIDLLQETDYKKPNPTKQPSSSETP